MPASEAVLTVVREWIVKAEHDLTAAVQILKLGKAAPTEAVCFHAQQCVEKYLKAVLVYLSEHPVPEKSRHPGSDGLGSAEIAPGPGRSDAGSTDILCERAPVPRVGFGHLLDRGPESRDAGQEHAP